MRTAIVVCVSALVLSCSANEPPGFAPEPDAGVVASQDVGVAPGSDAGGAGADVIRPVPIRDAGSAARCSEAAQLVYVLSDANDLYSFRPNLRQFTRIGRLSCPTSAQPNSMAIDRDAVAWVNYVNNA
jgi:hypothetical protein